ncbi:MAG: hypothetical protein ACKOU6_11440, partial [Planctomycetota bacterium]
MLNNLNLLGTNNLGKRDLHEKQAICGKCGQLATLQQYETSTWFFFLLPVLPLGKRQILDYCSSCSAHKSIQWQEWQEYRHRQMRMAVTTYAQKPDDPSAAIAAHQTLTLFSRPAEAQEVETALATQFRDDPHVQWYLAEYYRQQGQSELSEECIKHLLTLTDYDPGTVSRVAMAKILWHDLEDAKQLLERIDPSSLAVSSDAY